MATSPARSRNREHRPSWSIDRCRSWTAGRGPKVRGTALYAYEQPVPQPAYLYPVQATIAKGTVVRIDTGAAEALDGVLIVLTHLNAPRLVDTKDQELLVQSAAVGFRGQFIGAVVAESSEIARHAAGLVRSRMRPRP